MSEQINNEIECSGVSVPKADKSVEITNGDSEKSSPTTPTIIAPPMPTTPPPPGPPPPGVPPQPPAPPQPPPPPAQPQPPPLTTDVKVEQKYSDKIYACRDYLRGSCQRGVNCKFSHDNNYSYLSKSTVNFCHDYQNKTCTRVHCKFIHCTPAEESHYIKTGELPICKDFLANKCKRENDCQLRHVKGDPNTLANLTGALPNAVDPLAMTRPPPPKASRTSPWPAPLHEPPPGYGVNTHDKIDFEKIKSMPPPPFTTPALVTFENHHKPPVGNNWNLTGQLTINGNVVFDVDSGTGVFYNDKIVDRSLQEPEAKKAKYSDNSQPCMLLSCKYCDINKQTHESSLEKVCEALDLNNKLELEAEELNAKVDEILLQILKVKVERGNLNITSVPVMTTSNQLNINSNLGAMVDDGQPVYNNSSIRYTNAVAMSDMLPIAGNQLSNSPTIPLNRMPTMMNISKVDVNQKSLQLQSTQSLAHGLLEDLSKFRNKREQLPQVQTTQQQQLIMPQHNINNNQQILSGPTTQQQHYFAANQQTMQQSIAVAGNQQYLLSSNMKQQSPSQQTPNAHYMLHQTQTQHING